MHVHPLMSVRAAIGFGVVLGLAIGIVVSISTGVPFAPEAGLVLGVLLGWFGRALSAPRSSLRNC